MTPGARTALACIQNAIAQAGGNSTWSSGYRNTAYQEHFGAIWRGLVDLKKPQALANAGCIKSREKYNQEQARHKLVYPSAAPNGPHTQGIALDVSFTLPDGTTNSPPVRAGGDLPPLDPNAIAAAQALVQDCDVTS